MNETLLHAYLDGEVTPEERALVEQALASDPALSAQLARLVALNGALDAAFPSITGPSVTANDSDIAARAVKRARHAERGRILAIVSGVAAAAAALALIVLPRSGGEAVDEDWFSVEEQVEYVYWETDGDTYGSGDLNDLEDEILDLLETT